MSVVNIHDDKELERIEATNPNEDDEDVVEVMALRPSPKPSPKPSSKPSPKPSSKPSPKPSSKPSPKPSPRPLRSTSSAELDDTYGMFANAERVKQRVTRDFTGVTLKPPTPSPSPKPPSAPRVKPRMSPLGINERPRQSPPPMRTPPRSPYTPPVHVSPYIDDKKKRTILLAQLKEYQRRGFDIPKEFTYDSDVGEMEAVVEQFKESEKLKSGLLITRKLLVGFVGVVEWMNNRWDPLGAKLDGWSDAVYNDISSYDGVLTRIWERYGTVIYEQNPLVELMLTLTLSAVFYHITQKAVENMRRAMQPEPEEEYMRRPARPPRPSEADMMPPAIPPQFATMLKRPQLRKKRPTSKAAPSEAATSEAAEEEPDPIPDPQQQQQQQQPPRRVLNI